MIDDTTTQDMFDLLDRAEGKSLPASAASPATESETPTVESTSAIETEDQPASGTSAPAPVTAEPDSASSAGRDPFSVDTVPGLGSDTAGSLPETSDVRVFSGLDKLFAPHDWGDVLRLVNFKSGDIRLAYDQDGHREPLLRNPATGMWRLPDTPGFHALFDVMLSEANSAALDLAQQGDIVTDRVRRRLQQHVDHFSAGSVTKALKRAERLADDRCVPIGHIDMGDLNRLDRFPVLPCANQLISLAHGTVQRPEDLTPHYLLDVPPCPTAYVPEALESEAPGAVMLKRFLQHLGRGDERLLTQRIGWQLCGPHENVDVIAGDHSALSLLARALRTTLGAGGAQTASMGRGELRSRDLADRMERTRLCLWVGADTARRIPVWEIHALVSDLNPRRQGNVLLLVSDWPEEWEALDHRIAGKCGWAWRVEGKMSDHGIDPDVMLDQDGRQYLLAMLVDGASRAWRQFNASKADTGIGDPSQVAATDYSRACAEDLRVAGANAQHRTLYRALRFTDDSWDVMTLADIDDAVTDTGEEIIPHHVIGKMIRRMWPEVESDRDLMDGTQTRIIRRIAPRVHHSDLPESSD